MSGTFAGRSLQKAHRIQSQVQEKRRKVKQIKKEKKILKTGDFMSLKIITGGGSKSPVASLQLAGDYTPYDVCMLITSMKEVLKSLEENYPTEWEVKK